MRGPATAPAASAPSPARDEIGMLDARVSSIESTMRQIDGSLSKILDRLHDIDHR
jgi:hypothetical protein